MINHNGSEAGRSFAEAFMKASKELDELQERIVETCLAGGFKLIYPWDGWFCLEAGDLAQLLPVFPMGGTNNLLLGDRVAIVDDWKIRPSPLPELYRPD